MVEKINPINTNFEVGETTVWYFLPAINSAFFNKEEVEYTFISKNA